MSIKLPGPFKLLLAAGILISAAAGSARSAEIIFISASALRPAMDQLIADFQQSSGHKVTVSYANVGTITDRIRKGETADLSVTSPQQWDALQKEGKLTPDFRVQFARIGIAFAVKKGAAKPNLSSAEAVKRTLVSARAVAIADPAGGSAAGANALRLFERLGIATEMRLKTKVAADTDGAIEMLTKDDVDLVVSSANLIALSSAADLAGPLPADLQSFTVLIAGIPTTATQADAARALVNFLKSPAAAAAFKAKGIEPG
jgi:molybdate transport system substrate-binding protein